MRRILQIIASVLLAFLLLAPSAFAATTLLPSGGEYADEVSDMTAKECGAMIDVIEAIEFGDGGEYETVSEYLIKTGQGDFVLACAIKSGKIKFWMIPYFVSFALQFLISLAGLIAVLMIIIGAYYYMAGGLTDDKEKGKTIIKYALGGLVLTTLAWFIVNVILLAVTG